jgi:hypothetical protein
MGIGSFFVFFVTHKIGFFSQKIEAIPAPEKDDDADKEDEQRGGCCHHRRPPRQLRCHCL